ncbi:Protein involved in vacuolar polyphosphate accumulation, contains SPX domain [Handroanthus impetiginosus]|uniref:Protein involved in vacuolar polyphosphate accumulation, contains SPX domain n=1 Tax=Handroanthus impetiginosus TaxID=429701 RepID=A0A2G9GFV0_9LAMI|nr:Protein involved in vacuolar polyphosphate accumulation, contains SPX domain [Handroanthus impetiginosus]
MAAPFPSFPSSPKLVFLGVYRSQETCDFNRLVFFENIFRMKFGKSLSNQIEETLPEWRDKFLSYKELKKRLKLIEPKPQGDEEQRAQKRRRMDEGGGEREAMTAEEVDFVKLLEDELEKFNTFFVEKEEECIIRLKELQDRVGRAQDRKDEMIKIRKEIVDFHGEMVLLENYSALNYTGLVKILKKYDKRTGALLRLPFVQKVLQQPFFTTDLLYKLVKECERMLDQMFPENEASATEAADGNEPSTSSASREGLIKETKELVEIEYMKSLYMKSTITALRVLKEIRSGSSTVSAFSLPPLQINGLEDTWKKIPVLEQVAK